MPVGVLLVLARPAALLPGESRPLVRENVADRPGPRLLSRGSHVIPFLKHRAQGN